MDYIFLANWLKPCTDGKVLGATEFFRTFSVRKKIKTAKLWISALGIYSARINGEKISYVLAPGWTAYEHRVQYQEYDVTALLKEENLLSVTVAAGWRMPYGFNGVTPVKTWGTPELAGDEYAMIAALLIAFEDGEEELLISDESWNTRETKFRFCNLYQGDVYDETFEGQINGVRILNHPKKILVPQEGEIIAEQESFSPVSVIRTPKGETVLDFGQNLTGYLSFSLTVPKGKTILIEHAEVLDKDGNFYRENYRSAKARILYTGDGKPHTWKPEFTFYGFRYVRLTEFYGEVRPENFKAIVVHSDMERTGFFECSDEKINQLYHNIIWGQKGNFLDVPTDCPQRDERLGWTGDAQVFARCAAYNFNVNRFFRKWLTDMSLEQMKDGRIVQIVPRLDWVSPACGWSDAAVIIPWQMYLLYGDRELLARQYVTVKRWIDYMYEKGEEYIRRNHFGDWLAQDTDPDDCGGGTDKSFLAYAYRAYSTELFIRMSEILGIARDSLVSYEEKCRQTKEKIRSDYFRGGMTVLPTQTAHVLILSFSLCEEDKKQAHADRLAAMIRENGNRLTTGFLGTPYLLHVLTAYGYTELAYALLFQTECPSWLYSVERGATTMWEHWDGIRKDGSMCGADMNSFNHYAYGAVGDWLYGTVGGISPDEERPGFEHIRFAPKPTERLRFAKASLKTKYGTVACEWHWTDDGVRYAFTVPNGVTATAEIGDEKIVLGAGVHTFCR
ncbi:MAG: family 78 glycoside hydrolase catalytic domain [Clostridia bacterium]|nr:family 78 glycoside hydrolase catalytic domain [Clostridia bacterium]